MTNQEFFKALDFDDGLSVVTEVFRRFPLQYGTTLGLDGDPQIRPLEFKFEEDEKLFGVGIRLDNALDRLYDDLTEPKKKQPRKKRLLLI